MTLRHTPSGFSIQAPAGYSLSVSKGVYVLKKGSSTLSFSRSVTTVTAAQFGGALLQQLGGKVLSKGGDARQFTGQVAVGNRREAFVIARDGSRLAVTTSSSPSSSPLALGLVRQVGASARGGFALRAPAQTQTRSIALGAYRAPDGGATALVPTDPSWTIESTQGAIQGSSAKGSFIFGFSINIFLPGSAPANSGTLISPYLYAANALTQFFPRLAPTVSNIRITGLIKDAALPSFTSSGMFLIDYQVNGKPWTGAVTVGTDGPEKYSNFVWNFYYSGIGVPVGSNPAVGVGLLQGLEELEPERRNRGAYAGGPAADQRDQRDLAADERVPLAHGRPAVARRRLPAAGLLPRRGQLEEVRPPAAPVRPDLHRTELTTSWVR